MTKATSDEWGDVRIKWVLKSLESGRREVSDTDSFEGGALSIGGEHIGWKGEWLLDNPRYISREYYANLNTGRVRAGDVLLVKDGATIGKVAIAESLPLDEVAVNEHVFLLRVLPEHDARFYFYVLQSQFLQDQIQLEVRGAAQPGLNSEFKNVVVVPRPPRELQTAIAVYLDRETAEIDALIAEKQRMLTLLEEKRAALVTHAVTRGLNPNAPLKPSGLEWLGNIPEHWQIRRMKFLLDGVDQGWSPQCFNFPADEGRWAVLKTGCVNRGIFREQENKALPDDVEPPDGIEVHAGDVLMSRASGSVDLIGSVARVAQQPKARLLLSDKTFRLLPHPELLDAEFLVAAMGSAVLRHQIKAFISGAEGLANNIARTDIGELILPVPPFEEQQEIVSHLKRDGMDAGNLDGTLRSSIELLKERRSALITAAVTGRIPIGEMAG